MTALMEPMMMVFLGVLIGGLVIALLASTGAISNLSAGFALPGRETRVDENASNIVIGAWRSFIVLAATIGVLFAASRKRVSPMIAAWAVVAIAICDLWSIERSYWRFAPKAAELYAGDATIDYLKTAPTGRVWPVAVTAMTGTRRDPYLGSGEGKGTGFMVHGIRSIVGYHGNELGRYDEMTGWDTDMFSRRIGNPRVWQLYNVRYMYTNGTEPPIPGAPRLAGPARNSAGDMVSVYGMPGDNPPAWVTPIAVKVPDESALPTLLDARFDPMRVAMFGPTTTLKTQAIPATMPEPLGITVNASAWQPGRITLTLDRPAPANATLVVSENFYPGWKATVDGKAAKVDRADYVLIGVELPAGATNVDLTLVNAPYEKGKLLTLASLSLATLALVAGWVLETRRKAIN